MPKFMNANALVSIIMCSYNIERYIETTIQSMLNQTYGHFELLILDNGSTDSTVERIKNINDDRIRLFESAENLGPYKGLNYLLDRAKGNYVAIQDHDDLWHPEKLALQVDFLDKNAHFLGCGSNTIEFFEAFKAYYIKYRKEADAVTTHVSLVFRNGPYRYDEEFQFEGDHYFMRFNLSKEQDVIHSIPKLLALHRRRSDNANLNTKWFKRLTMQHYKRHYKVTGSLKGTIMFAFNRFFIPENWLMYVKRRVYDFRSLASMQQDVFLKPYYDLLLISNPEFKI